MRNYLILISCVFCAIMFGVRSIVFSDGPASDWYMPHANRALTAVTPDQGPETDVGPKWQDPPDVGVCVFPSVIGSDGYLYMTARKVGWNKPTYLRRIYPYDGDIYGTAYLGTWNGEAEKLWSTYVTVIELNGTDYIFTQQKGKVRKWRFYNNSLSEITTGNWSQGGVDIEDDSNNDLFPTGLVLSNDNETLITAAAESPDLNSTGLVIYAIDADDGSTDTFDLYDWIMDRKCTTPGCTSGCSNGSECFYYPYTSATVKNTISIGRKPGVSSSDHVYVIINEEFLFAIKWVKTTQSFGSVEWKYRYSPVGDGLSFGSSTSPTVVNHYSNDALDRVYFVSGTEEGEDTTLFSINASTGVKMAQTNFDIGRVVGSPVAQFISQRWSPYGGSVRIYTYNVLGPVRGFEDNYGTSTLSCEWITDSDIYALGGVGGKSKYGYFYFPFKTRLVGGNYYAGGFDPDGEWGGTGSPCAFSAGEGSYQWRESVGSSPDDGDECGRTIGRYKT